MTREEYVELLLQLQEAQVRIAALEERLHQMLLRDMQAADDGELIRLGDYAYS